MKLFIMQFSPAACHLVGFEVLTAVSTKTAVFACHFVRLIRKYSPQQSAKTTPLNLCFFLNVRDQISHPYKQVNYTIYFLFWDLAESEFGGSLESVGRFCVGAFSRNLALVVIKI
jgi:hypothetical protein